jgi:uncharacterized protein (DUF58 family)
VIQNSRRGIIKHIVMAGEWIWFDLLLSGHRLWYLAAIALATIGLIFSPSFYIKLLSLGLGLFLFLIAFIAELLYHLLPPSISYQAQFGAARAHIGDIVTVTTKVSNYNNLPAAFLQTELLVPTILEPIQDPYTPSGFYGYQQITDIFSLGSKQSGANQHPFFCTERGVHYIISVTLRSSDPLGWFTRSWAQDISIDPLIIYPLIVPLDSINIPAFQPFGFLPTHKKLVDDPLQVAGLRDYQIGDDPRTIHWKASARTGTLQSKLLDPGGNYRFVVVLDVVADIDYFWKTEPVLFEYAVTIAASLANWALDEGYPVGILGNTEMINERDGNATGTENSNIGISKRREKSTGRIDHLLWVPPAANAAQKERILTALARIQPVEDAPIERVIDLHRRMFTMGTTVILVCTPRSLREEVIITLLELRRHGLNPHLVLLSTPGFPTTTNTYDLPIHFVGGKDKWNGFINSARQRAATRSNLSGLHFSLD